MPDLKLDAARTIVATALDNARKMNLQPVAVVVLDGRGALKACEAEDGTSLKRAEIAHGKAHGALAMGLGSRTLFRRVKEQPYFIAAATHAVGGAMIPVPGGVLIRDGDGAVTGAVGVSGDASDNDEAIALAGIAAAGFTGDPGSD